MTYKIPFGYIVFYCIITSSVYSQTTDLDLGSPSKNSANKEFKYALNKQFTKIVTGTAFSNLGNFASISSDSKSFAVGGNIVSKEGVWGFEISGGATEGIFKLFNNEQLNSNFSGEIKYHKRTKTYFGARDAFEVAEIDQQIKDLQNQFTRDSLALVNQKDLYKLRFDIISSNAKILELNIQVKKIDSLLYKKPISKETEDSLNAKKALFLFEIENEKISIYIWTRQLADIEKTPQEYFSEELEKKTQVRDKKWVDLLKKRKNIELHGFDFQWISFGLRAKNNEFKFFEPNNLPGLQFKDTSFVSQRFIAAISRYRSTSFQSQDVYWSAGFSLDYSTNFSSLKKVEIEERIPVPGNVQQEIRKTINAYQGDYREGTFEFTLFYDYYRFFGQFNSILGVHVNPVMSYNSVTKKPLTNIQFGIIAPFGDKEKQTSKINIEVFYNRQDIFNYTKAKSSFWGIRATLPITIINYKL